MEEIKNRRSIRKYVNKPVSPEDITDIVYAATLAPSAKKSAAMEVYCLYK